MLSRSRVRLISSLAAILGLLASGAGSYHALAAGHPARTAQLSLVHPGYLTVGSDTTYPPQESIDPRTKQPVGTDIDLARALAGAMHLKGVRIVSNDFSTIIPALQRGNFDVIMSSMNDTPDRRKQIAFVDYMRASEAILVKKSSSIHADGYSGVCGHSVSVESATTELAGLQAASAHCKSKIDIKQYQHDTDAFQAFTSGHADAYTGDYPVCVYYVKQHPAALRLAGKAFAAGQNYGIGMLYRAKALRTAIKHALSVIIKSGQYKRILSKWGVGEASF